VSGWLREAAAGDAGPSGDIFGGWPTVQMDFAAGMVAVRGAERRTVTAAVDATTFLSPVTFQAMIHPPSPSLRVGPDFDFG
jgi:acyl-CoA hydrolase